MNKGIGALIFGLLALVGGLAFVAILVKSKLSKEKEFEDENYNDDFDLSVEDEEFEHFFGDNEDDDMFPENDNAEADDEIQVEILTEDDKPELSEDFEQAAAVGDTTGNGEDEILPNIDDELPTIDNSISDIDDDELMGITDDDMSEEQL